MEEQNMTEHIRKKQENGRSQHENERTSRNPTNTYKC